MPRPELGEPDHIADPATGSVALDGADGHARGRRPRRHLIAGVLVVVLVLTVAFALVLARIGLRSPRHRCRLRPTTVLVSADGVVVAEVTGAVTEQRLLAMIHDHLGVTTG